MGEKISCNETTYGYSYCRAIFLHQLNYAEQCPIQAEYDYPHGAPIALFTMLWVEGYINEIVRVYFPSQWEDERSFFSRNNGYPGFSGKVKFICDQFKINNSWEANSELKKLKTFRDNICHVKTLDSDEHFEMNHENLFIDNFQKELGTITEVKNRFDLASNFLTNLYEEIINKSNPQFIYVEGVYNENPWHVGYLNLNHPIFNSLSERSRDIYNGD